MWIERKETNLKSNPCHIFKNRIVSIFKAAMRVTHRFFGESFTQNGKKNILENNHNWALKKGDD